MPYMHVSDSIDVDIIEVLESCSNSELRDAADWLRDNEPEMLGVAVDRSEPTLAESEFESALKVLQEARLRLTQDETDTILAIARRYGIVGF
jgi:hypothetical protein